MEDQSEQKQKEKPDFWHNAGLTEKERKEQRRLFLGVAIASLAVLFYGGWAISRHLLEPFTVPITPEDEAAEEQAAITTSLSTETTRSLKEKDTDRDGVSDYDELYRYKTSAYISDSDSDGISDKDELDQGTDPNCPTGEDCGRQTVVDANTNSGILTNTFANANVAVNGTVADLNNLSTDELRLILRDSGVPEAQLNQISDEELLATYNEVLPEAIGSVNGLTNDATSLTPVDLQSLQNLTPDEIRQLLVQNGIPAETLETVDDAVLQQIFQESLSQQLEESSANILQ